MLTTSVYYGMCGFLFCGLGYAGSRVLWGEMVLGISCVFCGMCYECKWLHKGAVWVTRAMVYAWAMLPKGMSVIAKQIGTREYQIAK